MPIRDAINDIEEDTAAGREPFMAERIRQDAVIRKLEIIGEAVKQLSNTTKERRPEIPWKQIAGMRDRLMPRLLRCGSGAGLASP